MTLEVLLRMRIVYRHNGKEYVETISTVVKDKENSGTYRILFYSSNGQVRAELSSLTSSEADEEITQILSNGYKDLRRMTCDNFVKFK